MLPRIRQLVWSVTTLDLGVSLQAALYPYRETFMLTSSITGSTRTIKKKTFSASISMATFSVNQPEQVNRTFRIMPALASAAGGDCSIRDQSILDVYLRDDSIWLYEETGYSWHFGTGKTHISRFTCSIERNTENLPSRLEIKRSVIGNFLFDDAPHTLTFQIHPFKSIKALLGEYKARSFERHPSLL